MSSASKQAEQEDLFWEKGCQVLIPEVVEKEGRGLVCLRDGKREFVPRGDGSTVSPLSLKPRLHPG